MAPELNSLLADWELIDPTGTNGSPLLLMRFSETVLEFSTTGSLLALSRTFLCGRPERFVHSYHGIDIQQRLPPAESLEERLKIKEISAHSRVF